MTGRRWVIDNASIGTVVIENGIVAEIRGTPARGVRSFDAAGGAVLPGLWDHHVHLRAAAARRRSLEVSGASDAAEFAELLARAADAGDGWLRVVGYDDGRVGELDAARLDALVPTPRPLRVQHRGGHQWVLNSAGIAAVEANGGSVAADGVLWDDDAALHGLGDPVDAAAVRDEVAALASRGVVGATEMTPTIDDAAAAELSAAAEGMLRLRFFGSPALSDGGVKIVVSDASLPDPDELLAAIRAVRPKAVALHAVTAEALVLAAWALGQSRQGGDTIEHGFLCPADLVDALDGIALGAHPGFIRTHGDRVLRELPGESGDYQRLGSWLKAGLRMLGGTDLPFGSADPWAAMAAAVDRTTAGGAMLAPREALSPEQAFALFTPEGLQGESGPPAISEGMCADLCIIDRPWHAASESLGDVAVTATLLGGEFSWRSPGA